MKIYAMSDIHGSYAEFQEALDLILEQLNDDEDAMLVLLGDYVYGGCSSYEVLDRIIGLQRKYGSDRVVALLGNHEEMCLRRQHAIDTENTDEDREDRYLDWMEELPRYYATEGQIFCHAGINEEAGDEWEWATDDYTFTEKYPPETGSFSGEQKIIAGHIGTAEISGNRRFNDIYYDGESHYYIDGSVLDSGVIPVLMVDTETNEYYRVTESGLMPVLPYDEEYS